MPPIDTAYWEAAERVDNSKNFLSNLTQLVEMETRSPEAFTLTSILCVLLFFVLLVIVSCFNNMWRHFYKANQVPRSADLSINAICAQFAFKGSSGDSNQKNENVELVSRIVRSASILSA